MLLPTETVAGLAARADRADAVARIFQLKGRRPDKPLAVCVASLAAAEKLGTFSETARALAGEHWPGPLTLVVPARDAGLVPACLGSDAAGATVALRCPIVAWREALGEHPLALTSANLSGRPSHASVAAARADFPDVAFLSGAGDASGRPSTIISVRGERVTTLRAGDIVIGVQP